MENLQFSLNFSPYNAPLALQVCESCLRCYSRWVGVNLQCSLVGSFLDDTYKSLLPRECKSLLCCAFRASTGQSSFMGCWPVCPLTSNGKRRWWSTALLTFRSWMKFSPDTVSGQFMQDPMDGVREVNVNINPFFPHICRTMQNYLIWQLIIDRVSSLSRRFKDARARYRKVSGAEQSRRESMQTPSPSVCVHQTLYGTTVEDAWWRECVRYVQSSMENAVGALYVRETFAGESKQMVSQADL